MLIAPICGIIGGAFAEESVSYTFKIVSELGDASKKVLNTKSKKIIFNAGTRLIGSMIGLVVGDYVEKEVNDVIDIGNTLYLKIKGKYDGNLAVEQAKENLKEICNRKDVTVEEINEACDILRETMRQKAEQDIDQIYSKCDTSKENYVAVS